MYEQKFFCYPLQQITSISLTSHGDGYATTSGEICHELNLIGNIFKIGNLRVVGRTSAEIAAELLKYYLKFGMDAFCNVIGEYIVCIKSDEKFIAYRSITSGYRIYYTDSHISNQLLSLYNQAPTRDFDEEYIYHFLLRRNFVPHQFTKTPFKGISQLPAGRVLEISQDGRRSIRLIEHKALKTEAPAGSNPAEIAQQLQDVMVEVVSDRAAHFSKTKKLVCEVSGGLDSSFVASIVGKSFKNVSAYMFSFPESPSHRSSEHYAKAVADAHGLDFQVLPPETFFPFDLSEPLSYADEPSPYLWQGALFWNKVPSLIGDNCTIFSGVGSDQLFMRTPAILNWLLKQRRFGEFKQMLGQCSQGMERSAASLCYQSFLSLIPKSVYSRAMPLLRRLPSNLVSFEEVMAFHITDTIPWLKGGQTRHHRIIEDENAEHRFLYGDTADIRAPLANLMGPPISSVPMLEPHNINYDLPYYDWRLMKFVYENVGWDLVNDWTKPYKHLLRESQKGIVPEVTRTRPKNEFHFEGFLGKMVSQNEDYIRGLIQNHPLKNLGIIDDHRLNESLEINLFCAKTNSDNMAFFNLLGFLLWHDNFKRHAASNR